MKKSIMLSLVLVMALGLSMNAFATTRYHTGLECQMNNSDDMTNAYYTYNKAMNSTTSTRNFYCPVDINSDNGTSNVSGAVYVIDNHATSSITCSLRTIDWDGGSYNYSDRTTSDTQDSSTPVGLYFGTVSMASSYYYAYIRCYVPNNTGGDSGVHGYYNYQW